ncbi:MAG TPA: BamA/TamA family outer membrane protein [Gemmatimonadales bacterium]|nr:BamA/TamA family outer membrane protein [Gemmatimonadales bacterium]
MITGGSPLKALRRMLPLLGALLVAGAGTVSAQTQPRVVRGLKFEGNKSLPAALLSNSISTTKSSFFATNTFVRWIGLGEKRFFNEIEFQRDVLRLQVLYRRSGFPDVQVDTVVKRTPTDVFATFKITEGKPIVVTEFAITGLDSLPEKERRGVRENLPLRKGQPFDLSRLQASVDTVVWRLRSRGYPRADAFREYTVDSAARTATAGIELAPGQRMRVGTVRVEGTDRVDSNVVRALMVTREGRVYSESELFSSQANLYRSDLFRLAAVSLDSAAWNPQDTIVPLVVRVSESLRYRARASMGYATQDCFRTSAGLARRNFLGAGRILDVSGRLSKLGVGAPADLGLEDGFLCQALKDDSIGSSKLNYNVTASVRRPAFLSPQASITVSAFSERRSEFAIYLREDIGSAVAVTRESNVWRDPISVSYTFSYGRTRATPAVFCSYFNACTAETRSLQEQRRPLAILGLRALQTRVNNPVEPGRGHLYSGEFAWSSTLIGSSEFQQFTRFVAEGRWYATLMRGVVLATRVRGGVVFGGGISNLDTPTFIPVEHRFYGGGPNDVRGYSFNQLGPVVYVVDSADIPAAGIATVDENDVQAYATGGNTLAVGNVELRVPSPLLGSLLRFAVFVDVGSVWQRGSTAATPVALRATPGVGVRLQTPVGPFRLDVAYNPYRLQSGIIYENRPNGDLIEIQDPGTGAPLVYQKPDREGFKLNITVGQPF